LNRSSDRATPKASNRSGQGIALVILTDDRIQALKGRHPQRRAPFRPFRAVLGLFDSVARALPWPGMFHASGV
jgi:hypothetical protein